MSVHAIWKSLDVETVETNSSLCIFLTSVSYIMQSFDSILESFEKLMKVMGLEIAIYPQTLTRNVRDLESKSMGF